MHLTITVHVPYEFIPGSDSSMGAHVTLNCGHVHEVKSEREAFVRLR